MTLNHEAYEAFSILENFPLHIESITAFDGNLVVGTKQGHLLMYSTSSDTLSRMKITLLRSNINFSSKPILQIAVVPEQQILISLSDQLISIHDLSIFNLPLLCTISTTKGASAFDLDVKHHTSLTGEIVVTIRLVVAVRRKLMFFYWKGRQFHDLRSDFELPDVPKNLVWCGESVILAFKYDYWLYELAGNHRELVSSKAGFALLVKLSDQSIALNIDGATHFLDISQDTFERSAIQWDSSPLALVFDDPYILAVLSNGIGVHSKSPLLSVKIMQLAKVKCLVSSITSTMKKQIFAASPSHIWALSPISIKDQIHNLIPMMQFELALKLTEIWNESSEYKGNLIQRVKKLYAVHLFCQFKFNEAMKLFILQRTDLFFVIGLFPDFLPDEYKSCIQYPESIPTLEEDQLIKGLEELIHFLLQMRHHLKKKESYSILDQTFSSTQSAKSKCNKLQIIDTTLLKCYLKTNDLLVFPLLRMPDNRVRLDEGERVLRRSKKYAELVLLLKCHHEHAKALELLLKHSTRNGSPLFGRKHTVEYLQRLGPDHLELIFEYGGWVLKAYPESGLKIFIGTGESSESELLPRHKVLNFLKKIQYSMIIPYLEHVIWEWGDSNPVIHNELIYQYKENILELHGSDNEDEELNLRRAVVRKKLIQFLKDSKTYTAANVLAYFPLDDFFEERALLLGRLGQHNKAIELYVDVMNDVLKALEYCHSQYFLFESNKEVYLTLVKHLVRNYQIPSSFSYSELPIHLDKDFVDRHSIVVAHILRNFPNRLDVAEVLRVFSSDMYVCHLKEFILHSLIQHSMHKMDEQIHRGLTQSILQQTQSDLNSSQRQCQLLSDSTVCVVCHKKFTNSSAFAWYLDGEISHFFCKEQIHKE